MVEISVDASSIKSVPFVVYSENADYGKMIIFNIIADPKSGPFSPGDNMHFHLDGASLSVHDGTDFISLCSVTGGKLPSNMQDWLKVPLAEKGIAFEKGVLFEFTVSPNHLTSVTFEVGYASGLHPALKGYLFDLKTFAPEPDLGLVLGMKDNKVVITSVLPGTPAAKAGLLPGLLVRKIDGSDIASIGLKDAQTLCGPTGGVSLELMDPVSGKNENVVLTGEKIFR
jgi:hypothetical protein